MKKTLMLITLIFLFSCNEKEIKEEFIIKEYKETLLVFKTIPKDTIRLKKGGLKFSPVINLINNNDEEILDITQKKKKVKIKNNENSFIRHVYRMDDLYFELDQSDTILYFEKDFFPIYKTKSKLINLSNKYEYIRKKYLSVESPSNWKEYFIFNIIINKQKKINDAKQDFVKKMLEDELKESHLLDTLFKAKKLTINMYNLQKSKLKFKKYNTFLSPQFKKLKKKYLIEDSLIKQTNRPELIKFKFYKSFLNNYFKNKYQIKNINYSNNSFSNPKTFFDSITKMKNLNKGVKEFLLTEKLEEIAEKLPQPIFSKYFKLFNNIIKDSIFKEKIENKYLLKYADLKKSTSTVNLISKSGKKIILEDFINKHKGKLVYIDFWASWCAPCIKEFPSSNKLQEIYKSDNVIFLYISTDSNKNKWENANVKYDLINKNSFLAINYPNAEFFKELELKTIPRYILFNKKGKLIHRRAPRPSSNEIRILFDKYLNE